MLSAINHLASFKGMVGRVFFVCLDEIGGNHPQLHSFSR